MITLRSATSLHVNTVLADLSAITAADLAAHQLDNHAIRNILARYFLDGSVHAMLDDDYSCICVAGVALHDDQWICWMLAREPFWTVRPSIWRILRRYSRTVLKAVGEPIHSYSGSPHPQLGKWMAALGFEEQKPMQGFRHFIYGA